MTIKQISNSVSALFWRWAARRSPKAETVVLRHKSIYVLPGGQGFWFMFVIVVMWLLGTNYQNNLVLALAFMLISIMIISVIHAFKNLSGLRFKALGCEPVFAGDYASFVVLLEPANGTDHESVALSFERSVPLVVDLIDGGEQRLNLSVKTSRRGWFEPERLLVKSYFPLGLIRAWSWIQLDMKALVYPAPLASDQPPLQVASAHQGDYLAHEHSEDFQGFLRYQAGAPLTHIAWKQFARGAGLHLKDYVGYQNQQVWLDWHSLAISDTETRLSQLCYWALEFGKTQIEFGLRLPDCTIELGAGGAHQAKILRALALYGLEQSGADNA